MRLFSVLVSDELGEHKDARFNIIAADHENRDECARLLYQCNVATLPAERLVVSSGGTSGSIDYASTLALEDLTARNQRVREMWG